MLLQRQAWTDRIIILIAAEQAMKMLLAEENDMIQVISADRTDEPFAVTNDILWRYSSTAGIG